MNTNFKTNEKGSSLLGYEFHPALSNQNPIQENLAPHTYIYIYNNDRNLLLTSMPAIYAGETPKLVGRKRSKSSENFNKERNTMSNKGISCY